MNNCIYCDKEIENDYDEFCDEDCEDAYYVALCEKEGISCNCVTAKDNWLVAHPEA